MPVVTIEEAYQILGVTSSTPEEDVKKAYKKLALRTHPGISELIMFNFEVLTSLKFFKTKIQEILRQERNFWR